MAVLFETSLGDFVVDLFCEKCPKTSLNFIKLCKAKYYNNVIFHSVIKDFIVQTGDPSGTGNGGQSVYSLISPSRSRFIDNEINKTITPKFGSVLMATAGENKIASQFFIVTSKKKNLENLKKYPVIGKIGEGMETVMKINDAFLDANRRPLQNIRLRHSIILEDPFEDPSGLDKVIPDKSPVLTRDHLDDGYIPDDIDLSKPDERTKAERDRELKSERAKSDSTLLEVLRDIPHRDIKPDENTLFVCQLNPITTDEDLLTIFSQFGEVVSCEVVRDYKTGDSLQYAFVEFEQRSSCEMAYLKMDNVLLDDRRIRVDWTQSVAKQWERFNKGDRSMLDQGSFDFRPQFPSRHQSGRSDSQQSSRSGGRDNRPRYSAVKKDGREGCSSFKQRRVDKKTPTLSKKEIR